MITNHVLARIRRQMHQRIRVIVAQRRTIAEYHRSAERAQPPAGSPAPPQPGH